MIRIRFTTVLSAILVAGLAGTAHASLVTINVTPSPVVGAPASEVDLLFEIFNTGQLTPVTLVSVTSQIDPAIGELDTFFGDAFDLVLAADATAGGTLGTFRFAAGAATGATLSLVFSFFEGVASSPGREFVEAASVPVQVVTTPRVPEPTSLALVGLGLAVALSARRRSTRR